MEIELPFSGEIDDRRCNGIRYDEINDTLIETALGGHNKSYGKIANDRNVLYVKEKYIFNSFDFRMILE